MSLDAIESNDLPNKYGGAPKSVVADIREGYGHSGSVGNLFEVVDTPQDSITEDIKRSIGASDSMRKVLRTAEGRAAFLCVEQAEPRSVHEAAAALASGVMEQMGIGPDSAYVTHHDVLAVGRVIAEELLQNSPNFRGQYD